MSRSARKQAQREAYEKAMRKRRHAMWNPDLKEDELAHFRTTCDRMFSALESVSRPAAVATRPTHDQPTPKSHAGGTMLMAASDEWPTDGANPLSAAMEIHLSELPTRPAPLENFELLQVFLELVLDNDEPAYRDGKWVIRRIADANNRSPSSRGLVVPEVALAWNLIEHDIPTYPDDLDLISHDIREQFEQLPNWSGLLADRFPSGLSTRVGGWPQWVDGRGVAGTFCLQIDGNDVGIDMSFDGGLYIGFDEETQSWECVWEIG